MAKWSAPVVVALALWALTFAAVQGRQTDAKRPTLAAHDIAEIQQLSANYARALGTCAAEDYAAQFTPDGSYSSSEFTSAKHRELFGTTGGRAVGRDRLMELVRTEPYCMDPNGNRTAGAPPVVEIEPSPEGAKGRAVLSGGSRYEDVYVRTAAGWRIKARSHIRAGQEAFGEGSQGVAKTMTLTAQDEAEIRQLSVRYATALGLCRAEEYAAVFTADGFYSSSEFTGATHRQLYGPNGGKIPRADMVRFVMSEPQCANATAPKTARSAPLTIVIKPSAEGATATIPLANNARYEDVYVKTSEGWRIRSRQHVRAGQHAFGEQTK